MEDPPSHGQKSRLPNDRREQSTLGYGPSDVSQHTKAFSWVFLPIAIQRLISSGCVVCSNFLIGPKIMNCAHRSACLWNHCMEALLRARLAGDHTVGNVSCQMCISSMGMTCSLSASHDIISWVSTVQQVVDGI